MSHQAAKRPIENIDYTNDDLNNEDYDVTWGGKKSRYLYNYTALELPDIFSNVDDSDQSESVLSIQTKSTVEVLSENDLSSSDEKCCKSDCQKDQDSDKSDLTEFEIDTYSSLSSCDVKKDFSSDSSSAAEYEVSNKIIIFNETTYSSDSDGYSPEDKDIQGTIKKTHAIPPPACFRTCLQCGKENPNPYFQYCFKCYRYRIEFFNNKPGSKERKKKRSSKRNKELNSNQDSGVIISQKSDTLTQKENDSTPNGKTSDTEEHDKSTNKLCNICFIMPKNGVFNHGKIGHIFCCYPCAKKIRDKSNRCPVCKVKIQFVTKMITV